MKSSAYLPRPLPAGLEAYAELVTDLRWTWSHTGDALWMAVDPTTWEDTGNPYVVLQNLSEHRLLALSKDRRFRDRLARLAKARADYNTRPGWYGEQYGQSGLKGIAYFSMEFGLGEALPLYAGGLGILAGDYLKGASDLAVPVVGVGLLYQEGYFRQMLDSEGWQQEIYPYNDATNLPIRPVRSASGAWLKVSLQAPGRSVQLRVWEAQVGRVSLYLLDSNDPMNGPADRGITGKLYDGGQEMRLVQEIALGICGWRVLEALGLEIDVCHLNEGHAAFATLERARCFMERNPVDFWEALWATRAGNAFTTHTPVAAGFDTFSAALMGKYAREYAAALSVAQDDLLALGRAEGENSHERFSMAYLAARTCLMTNGVSRLHGEVSRLILQPLYPRWPERQVPVSHITNGVHVPTWDSPWADEAWTRACGKERWRGGPECLGNAIVENLDDAALWRFRNQARQDLVRYARERLARQLGQRGAGLAQVAAAQDVLDPTVLTLGFARRFTEYKRPNLMLRDADRLVRLLTNLVRPVQIIVAGKAHPEDHAGKALIQQWAHFITRPEVRLHAVFLEDYDMALAQELVQGVDLWINTPRRAWEACGTSGMKVLVNGGLNLSELDGWWAEAYDPEVGWAIGDAQEHHEPEWDGVEAESLYDLLEAEILPSFYRRDSNGIPCDWVARMRASMSRLAPQFSTNRMVREYVERIYLPASQAYRQRTARGGELTKFLQHWATSLTHHWQGVHWGNKIVSEVGDLWRFQVQVYLGELAAEFIRVQLYAECDPGDECVVTNMQPVEAISGAANGFVYSADVPRARPATHFTPRVVPYHPLAGIPTEMNCILWWPGDS